MVTWLLEMVGLVCTPGRRCLSTGALLSRSACHQPRNPAVGHSPAVELPLERTATGMQSKEMRAMIVSLVTWPCCHFDALY